MPENPTYHDLPPTRLYRDIRGLVCDGDIALFRNGGGIGRTQYGDGTHTGLCHWNRDQFGRPRSLYVVQFREWRGCEMVPLSKEIAGAPGRIDLYRPTCSPDVAWMAQELLCRQLGKRYGWGTVAQALFMRLTFLRLLTGWTPDRGNPMLSAWYDHKDCSEGVVWALRTAAGKRSEWDILPEKPSKSAVPSDLQFTASAKPYARGLMPDHKRAA